MVFQSINDIPTICVLRGIYHAVISPGSRNAPLTLAFARHPDIHTKVIPDERSAGFIALGMAQELGKPVVLICTSGTATLNYGPAIAEAFFQNIPLIVLTADRPPELIGTQDGQSIYQEYIYGKHVKASFKFDADYNRSETINEVRAKVWESLHIAESYPKGPVHINVPFREPFYPSKDDVFEYPDIIEFSKPEDQEFTLSNEQWEELLTVWKESDRILILGGQYQPNDHLKMNLGTLGRNVVVTGDVISNLHDVLNTFHRLDIIPGNNDDEYLKRLQPDLLITFGNSTVSKNLKLFLRKLRPKHHWHIQQAGEVADTYLSITNTVRTTPEAFFERIKDLPTTDQNEFENSWNQAEENARSIMDSFMQADNFCELDVVSNVLEHIPKGTQLHLANSLSVRLVNFIGISENSNHISVYSNRGTSGIDGSNSTAMGMALTSEKPVVLITGDMAFFYDRNAFWHNYNPKNLFIILLNNHAGGIFGVIDGPSQLPELKEYFEAHQKLTAGYTAAEFEMDYFYTNSFEGLGKVLINFFVQTDRPKILEIETDLTLNKQVFQNLKNAINKINF